MNCDQLKDLLEAYALDALEVEEQAIVEQHLAGCPDCQQLADEFAAVAHLLPQALATTSSLHPPASLKARLLRSVKNDASPDWGALESETIKAPETPPSAEKPPVSVPGKSNKPPQPRQIRRPWSLWGRSRTLGVLAALILLILSVVLGTRLSNALAQERALRAELAQLFGQQEVVLEIVDSDKTVRRVLLPPELADNADRPPYGKLFTRSDLPHVVAMVARLPEPPAGQAYHLWLTEQGQTRLAGLMSVNEDGFSLLAFDADQEGPTYDAIQLTLQPEGSTTPSGDPILVWDAAQP